MPFLLPLFVLNARRTRSQDTAPHFTERLQERARRLIERLVGGEWNSSVPAEIERRIALAVEQIDELRGLHEQDQRHLLRKECEVGTELLALRRRFHPSEADPKRLDRLTGRLREIEQKRRDLAAQHVDRLQQLHEKLLDLLNQHRQLDLDDNGH